MILIPNRMIHNEEGILRERRYKIWPSEFPVNNGGDMRFGVGIDDHNVLGVKITRGKRTAMKIK